MILLIGLTYGWHPLQSRLQVGSACPGSSQLTADIAQLFFIHERPAAGRHNVVFGLEFESGTFGSGSLFPQWLQPLLQPVAGTAVSLILRVQLVKHVAVDNGVSHFRGHVGIRRTKIDLQHVALTDALDVSSSHHHRNRGSSALRLCLRFGTTPPQTSKNFIEWPDV